MKNNYFKCDYCYSFASDKILMQMHENECLYNPKNKHCNSCAYRKLKIDSDTDTREYVCKKGFIVYLKESKTGCDQKHWKKATLTELKKRSLNQEFMK